MAVASPVDRRVNSSNTAQRYVLWGNGRIDAYGGAIPVTGQANWYDRIDQPVAVALHISNWATGAGYIFTANGSVHEFNGAAAVSGGVFGGVPYLAHEKRYIDWSWDTAGSGQLYVLDVYGQLYAAQGATAPPRTGRRWSWPAAKKLVMQWSPSKMGVVLDVWGGVQPEFGTTGFSGGGGTYWRGKNFARDIVVTDWTTASNVKGYKLAADGTVHAFGGATATFGFPKRPGADVARGLGLISATDPVTLWEVWSGGQQWEWSSSTAPTVVAGGGTNEIQSVTITGSPTGGSFTLTFSGQTTAAIAFNATATTVQTALRALSNIGSTGVTVTGGPGPGTAWVVTFTGTLATTDVAQMTATSSLTGGTSPAVTVATTQPGEATTPTATVTDTTRPVLGWTYSDAQGNSQDGWELYVFTQAWVSGHTMTDPSVWASSALVAESGINSTTRGVASRVDLPNGTYRFYVRAKDTSDLWSSWSNFGWTQNIATPATPTGLSATANQATWNVALSVAATTGGAANLVRFECSDDGGVTWGNVRGADAVTLAATTTATDYDAKLGVARLYRATAYAVDPAVASVASSTATATLTTLTTVLRVVGSPTLGGEVRAQEPIEWERPVRAGLFEGLGAPFVTVLSDGAPKGRRLTLNLMTLNKAAYQVVKAAVEANATLVYRDQFGELMYCRLVDGWRWAQVVAAPEPTETTAVRHLHTHDLPLIEVKPPQDA